MILNDNLNKFSWVFTNAFRKYLSSDDEYKAKDDYGKSLYKIKLDDYRTGIYAYTGDDIVDSNVPRGLTLVGIHYKEQNAFVFDSKTDVCNFPAEYLIIKDEMKKPKGRKRKELTTYEVRQLIMNTNSFDVIGKQFTLSVGNMYIRLLGDALVRWKCSEYNEAYEISLSRMYEAGVVPVADGEILCDFVKSKLAEFVASSVSDRLLHNLISDYPNLVQGFVHTSDKTAAFLRSVCEAKDINNMLRIYSESREPSREVRVLRAIQAAKRTGYKKVKLSLDYGYASQEIEVRSDITKRENMVYAYEKQRQFKYSSYQIMQMECLTDRLEEHIPFIKSVSVGSRTFFYEDVEHEQSKLVFNNITHRLINDEIEDAIGLLKSNNSLDFSVKTDYDKYFLVQLVSMYELPYKSEGVFLYIRDNFTIDEDVIKAIQEVSKYYYGNRKQASQILTGEVVSEDNNDEDDDDDEYKEGYEDGEYEDEEEWN